MTIFNRVGRKIINRVKRRMLTNKDFSLISSNCNGSFILHDLGIEFNTPTINLWIKPDDYIKFLQNLHYYLEQDLIFIEEPNISYPVGVLDDIKIYFQHYETQSDAKNKWVERSKKINYNNLYILFTDRDGCTYQNSCDFDALPYQNKVVFTHIPYPEFESAYYIKGWEKEECVGMCHEFKNKFSAKRIYDDFDYIVWFNHII